MHRRGSRRVKQKAVNACEDKQRRSGRPCGLRSRPRRFTPALVILSAAPLSLVGAFGLLLLTGTPLLRRESARAGARLSGT